MAEEEEEVVFEVEAVESVYEKDCTVLQRYPPHLNIHIKPRTAEDSSQQFVEAVLCLQAGPKYPEEPPQIDIKESKGLDEERKARLLNLLREKSVELCSCLMLVALCEEAVEALTNMNHPDGDCPLCLYTLLQDDTEGKVLPFMKLMSCFHCFHSECIIRWWKWLQEQKETNPDASSVSSLQSKDSHGTANLNPGLCPVCRMVFQTKDIEHVLDLVGTSTSPTNFTEAEIEHDKEVLQSEAENARREKFEALLKLQEENSGLIEPKKTEVLRPGMFLPVPEPPVVQPKETAEPIVEVQQQKDPICKPTTSSETGPSRSSNKPSSSSSQRRNWGSKTKKIEVLRPGMFLPVPEPPVVQPKETAEPIIEVHQQTDPICKPTTSSETGPSRSSNKPSSSSSQRKNWGSKTKNKSRDSREQQKKWTQKDIGQ